MKRKIAILFHEKARRWQKLQYLINVYAEFWRADGHEVVLVFGTAQFVPADLVIVHVDLSVVPEEYLEFAKRCPIVLNGEVKDIRKSTYSRLLVKPGDSYEGKVIVKSNLNNAGVPELVLGVSSDMGGFPAPVFRSPADYRIFNHQRAVPPDMFTDPDLVVERFQPEKDKDLFFMRALLFLGDRVTCTRMASQHPIVNGSSQIRIERVEPHPDIVKLAKAMKFDCGKFDYVIHDGQALLLDANKTVGAATIQLNPELEALRRYRAEGLYFFFERSL